VWWKLDRQDLEDLSVEERIFLKWLLREEHWMAWMGFIWLRQEYVVGPCVLEKVQNVFLAPQEKSFILAVKVVSWLVS